MNFGKTRALIFSIILIFSFCHSQAQKRKGNNHNPAIEGWYADPEGPFMFVRNGKYYFMWSEGNWTGPDYSVAYAIADSPL